MAKLGMLNRSAAQFPSPVAWANDDGLLVGHNGLGWLYRVLPLQPLTWEDQVVRDEEALRLYRVLSEIAGFGSPPKVPGTTIGAHYREFHFLRLTWDEVCAPKDDGELGDWQRPVLSRFSVGRGLLCLGVRLKAGGAQSEGSGTIRTLRQMVRQATKGEPDSSVWAADASLIASSLAPLEARPPTSEERQRMESWWNDGQGSSTVIVPSADGKSLATEAWVDGLEMSALFETEQPQFDPRVGMWLAEALTHQEGCVAVSVRGVLLPSVAARTLMRKSQRKALSRIEEQAQTGDLDREEDMLMLDVAQAMESVFVSGNEPLLRDVSMVFARRASSSDNTFREALAARWGFRVKVVEQRQIKALEETVPCSAVRLASSKPFSQDMTVGVLATAGIRSFSEVGDDNGLWMGVALHDMTPVWLDPLGAARQNKPPAMCVVGEPGSGKTFFLQLLATQASLTGLPVVFVNPKPADRLDDFVEAVGGEVISLSSMATTPGALDPFRFAEFPESAAEIASAHIQTVMTEMDPRDSLFLEAGLKQAAMAGARCVGEALQHKSIPQRARDEVAARCVASELFSLGISAKPQTSMVSFGRAPLTMIQFDRPIPLPSHVAPTAEYEPNARIAVAVVRLITRAALEMMFQSGGGVLILDEAHVFLSSQEGRAILTRLGREGRSQRILPILATQRIADLLAEGVDMGSYLGRALVLKMNDPDEAAAALQVVGLEPTEERAAWLREAGPIEGVRGALGLLRGLNGRCSAVTIGPVPDDMVRRWSTNYEHREARERERELAESR